MPPYGLFCDCGAAHALEELRQVGLFYAPLVKAQLASDSKDKDKDVPTTDVVGHFFRGVPNTDILKEYGLHSPALPLPLPYPCPLLYTSRPLALPFQWPFLILCLGSDLKAPLASLSGPDTDKDQLKTFKDLAAGICLSTYPTLSVSPSGTPN